MFKGKLKENSLLNWTCIEYKDNDTASFNFNNLRSKASVNIEMKLENNNILIHSDNIHKLTFPSVINSKTNITNLYSILK